VLPLCLGLPLGTKFRLVPGRVLTAGHDCLSDQAEEDMLVKIVLIVVATIIVSVCGAIIASAGSYNDQEVNVEEAIGILNQAIACARSGDLDKLCDLGGSRGICRHQWVSAGGEQAVPVEPPEITDTYLLPAVQLQSGGRAVGGRVLVLEGVDGLGRTYRTEFYVFRSRHSGLGGLAVTNVVYWCGYGIDQCDEDGRSTTPLSPSVGVG